MTDQQQTGSSTSSPSLKLDPDIQIDIVQSNEKFVIIFLFELIYKL